MSSKRFKKLLVDTNEKGLIFSALITEVKKIVQLNLMKASI